MCTLWRKLRHRHQATLARFMLKSPLFQHRVQMWSFLQDLGSNTRRRFERCKQLRSLDFPLAQVYALRRLAIHLEVPQHTLALQALQETIAFKRGKSTPRIVPLRAPWLLAPNLSQHLSKMLQRWYFSLRGTHVPFHQPTFKVLFAKHPAVHEILCNFKAAVQDWSDSVPAKCTCALLRQFPSCSLVPLRAESHLVLDGAKTGPLFVFSHRRYRFRFP